MLAAANSAYAFCWLCIEVCSFKMTKYCMTMFQSYKSAWNTLEAQSNLQSNMYLLMISPFVLFTVLCHPRLKDALVNEHTAFASVC